MQSLMYVLSRSGFTNRKKHSRMGFSKLFSVLVMAEVSVYVTWLRSGWVRSKRLGVDLFVFGLRLCESLPLLLSEL